MDRKKTYICIDLKSFYASVECRERSLDPMKTNLVVADPERTEKTICLAVSPAMKKLGVPGRCRVFEIPPNIDYIMAPPRMQLYIQYSAEIYAIYLKYISKEDIHVYSIDEVFMDVTDYLTMYGMGAKELAVKIMQDVRENTGITATAGIGDNMYLAKIALDIMAKHAQDGIGILNEESYREKLWGHKPLTDFWRIGRGLERQLAGLGIFTMGQLAHAREEVLYKQFGVDAELMIDHAWGRESATIADVKAYKAKVNSLCSGQVLDRDYGYEEGLLIVKEMTDLLCLELVDKGLVTNGIALHISYNKLWDKKSAHGTASMSVTTSSAKQIMSYTSALYERIMDPKVPIRKVTITFLNVVDEGYAQYDLFTDPAEMEREYRMQKAMLDIKEKFGKNAILKGMNLDSRGKTIERNRQIGGHKSGE